MGTGNPAYVAPFRFTNNNVALAFETDCIDVWNHDKFDIFKLLESRVAADLNFIRHRGRSFSIQMWISRRRGKFPSGERALRRISMAA